MVLIDEGLCGYVARASKVTTMTKNISDLILELQHATGPDRALDVAIAVSIGWEKKVTFTKDEAGAKTKNVIWLFDGGKEKSRVPYFTSKLDVAQELAQNLNPGCAGGYTWNPRYSTARIDEGPIFSAATPAIAVCAAALSAKFHLPNVLSEETTNA